MPEIKTLVIFLQKSVAVIPEQSFEHGKSRRIELVSAFVFFKR